MSLPPKPQFDSYADSYDALQRVSVRVSGEEPDYFAAYKVAYIAARLRGEVSPGTFLDFGCGVGNSIPHLTQAFPDAQVLGLDVSGESVALARDANPTARFEIIGQDTLPLADASVDVAMAACVFHHIPPAQRLAWTKELKRVLKPGGRLFIFEHNMLNPVTRKVVRECPFDDDAILLPRSETLGLLRDAGLAHGDARYIVFFPRMLAFLRPLERFMGWLPAGAQYVACGRA